jgi:hypothetical protein
MMKNKGIYLVLLACALAGGHALALEATAPSGIQAPVAKKANDRRSTHYRLRELCAKQAQDQGLQGEENKVAVQLCLQGK